jgi:polyisoprenoid-binding protein YceI
MTRRVCLNIERIAVMIAATAWVSSPLAAGDATNLQVRSGVVKFDARTNVSAISVHGESSAMSAELILRKAGSGVEVDNLRAVVDPKSLSTGMSLRDQHMRKRIFAASNDQLPELEFVSAKSSCADLPHGPEVTCRISGNLSLRGVARPFEMDLKVRNEGKAYRVSGDAVVKLSNFGIEPPCQLGVCVTDDVKLRVEFQAKETMGLRSGVLR